MEANLSHADLSKANLVAASLDEANLSGANLSGAALTTADLTQARDLIQAQLDSAWAESGSPPILDEGLEPPATTEDPAE